jgi:DNA-binding beta-propeller fold protein YncE
MRRDGLAVVAVTCAMATSACGGSEAAWSPPVTAVAGGVQTVADRVATIEGFSGPESVRYDPDQDVWFVGNMNGGSGERDGNGFVARVSAETGRVDSLHFARGSAEAPLHAPRGMFIVGDTLWVVDIDGVQGFDRRSGAQLTFIDLSSFSPGFLNDVALGPDSALYVTDTGRNTVYRIADHEASEVRGGNRLGAPNGITFDPARGMLVTVPWEPSGRVHAWRPGSAPEGVGPRATPGRLDGVEPFGGRLLVASQSDSSLCLVGDDGTVRLVRVPGGPADIGIDTRRGRVAVPYIALDRVDVWALPPS